jgi:hypothetical protein
MVLTRRLARQSRTLALAGVDSFAMCSGARPRAPSPRKRLSPAEGADGPQRSGPSSGSAHHDCLARRGAHRGGRRVAEDLLRPHPAAPLL